MVRMLVSGEQPSRDFFSPVQLGCPRPAMHQWKKHKKLNTALSTRGTLENVHGCSILTRSVRTLGKTLSRPLGCFICLRNRDEIWTKTKEKWRNFYTREHFFLFIIIIVNNF